MEFVTIHDLSRELNVPSRVIRYRLLQLIAERKFTENEDFRRDDYKDDLHFVWRIHPIRFMEETGLKPPQTTSSAEDSLTVATNLDNQTRPVATDIVNNSTPTGNEGAPAATKPDTRTEDQSLAREMIDLLKSQIAVKDGQLREQGEQLKETHQLNLKLTGTMLQQAQEIKNLLRLTEGRTELTEVVTKDGNVVNHSVNKNDSTGTNSVNESAYNGNRPEVQQAGG